MEKECLDCKSRIDVLEKQLDYILTTERIVIETLSVKVDELVKKSEANDKRFGNYDLLFQNMKTEVTIIKDDAKEIKEGIDRKEEGRKRTLNKIWITVISTLAILAITWIYNNVINNNTTLLKQTIKQEIKSALNKKHE